MVCGCRECGTKGLSRPLTSRACKMDMGKTDVRTRMQTHSSSHYPRIDLHLQIWTSAFSFKPLSCRHRRTETKPWDHMVNCQRKKILLKSRGQLLMTVVDMRTFVWWCCLWWMWQSESELVRSKKEKVVGYYTRTSAKSRLRLIVTDWRPVNRRNSLSLSAPTQLFES